MVGYWVGKCGRRSSKSSIKSSLNKPDIWLACTDTGMDLVSCL
jgi:hypothetical protein